jgi:hypothetical protein
MESNYVDVIVKRRTRYIDILIRFMWIAVMIWGSLLTFMLNGMLCIVFVCGNATLVYFFWNYYKLDYEYVYCDGQIDFDLVRNNNKRKHRLRINLENAELLAPAESEKVINYRGINIVERYISHTDSPRIYALIVKKQDRLMKLLIEPNIKMLRLMRNKMPRRVELRAEDLARVLEKEED